MAKNQKNKLPRKVQHNYTAFEVLSRVYVLLMLSVFPLYVTKEKYINLTTHKANFFFIATISFLVLLCIVALDKKFAKSRQKIRIFEGSLSITDWALLAFLILSILSAILSPYPKYVFLGLAERYDGLVTTLLYGGAFFALSRFYKPNEKDFLLFAISAMFVSIIGILQYYGADIFSLFPHDLMQGYTGKTIQFRTTLGNIDIVSSYTSLTVLFFGILYVKSAANYRFVYLAAGALSTFLMVLGGAEAGIVGSLGAFVLAIPFILTDYKSIYKTTFLGFVYAMMVFLFDLSNTPASFPDLLKNRWLMIALALLVLTALIYWIGPRIKIRWSQRTVRIIGTAAVVLVLLIGFLTVEVMGKEPSRGTIYQAREMMHGRIQDEFGTNRGFIWNRSFRLLTEDTSAAQLLIGSGPDTFVDRFEPYSTEAVLVLDTKYDKAHNEYLQILFCQGLLGLLAYLAFLAVLLIKAIPRAFNDPLLLAAGLAAVSYMIQAFFSISVPIATPLFWILLGIAALHCKKRKSTNADLGHLPKKA